MDDLQCNAQSALFTHNSQHASADPLLQVETRTRRHASSYKRVRGRSHTVEKAASVLSLGVCENRDGWLVAWGFCG